MRLLAVFLLIPVVGALAALLWGLVLTGGDIGALRTAIAERRLPGPSAAESAPAPEAETGGGLLERLGLDTTGGLGPSLAGLAPEERFAAIVGREATVGGLGPGESRHGITIESAATDRAVILLPSGQRVTLTAPEGHSIRPRFAAPPGGLGAVWALIEGSPDAPPLALSIADIEPLRRASLGQKIEAYGALAESLSNQKPPAGVTFSGFRHDARGVFYCMTLERADLGVLVGARLDRGLLVTSPLRPGCGDPGPDDLARLGQAVSAVEPERWR